MPSNRLILRKMGSPWRTQHSDITRGTTLTHADLDNNFIFLKGEVIDSARLDGETLKLTKICGADIELNLSALTQTNEDSLRVLSDTSDEIKNNFNTDVTNINTTINEFKSDVENNSVWEWVDNRKNEVKIKGSGNTDTIVYAPKLNINIEPANDNSLTQVLVRDDNGNVKYKDIKSFTDLNVVSGVYDIKSGIVKLTNNEGGSFEISGFTSGMTDSYTDEAYLKGNTIYFNSNIKGDDIYSVDISPILDDVINSVGYNDRGDCSIKSYNEYQVHAQEYTKIKKVYDGLQSNIQQLEEVISLLQSQLFDAKNQVPLNQQLVDELRAEITQNEEDLAQTKAQIKEIEASGDLEFVSYMPVNEVNFNCWSDSKQTELLSNEINITNNNITEQVEIINKSINDVIYNVGYNDRGECSLDSFNEYRTLAENYINTKEVYDELQSNKQQLEVTIADLQSQLVGATTPEERDFINNEIEKNQADLKQTIEQVDTIKASGDLDFADYMPVNEVNFNCWSDSKQTEFLSNEINITNNNVTEEVEIINKNINGVVESVGYSDRGECSLNSFTEYESIANNYTNTKNEYDELQSNKQQLEVTIGDLQSQLADAQSQNPVNEELVNLLQENIAKNQEDLKQTKAQIKEIEASGDLDFADYMPVNESNFNCWTNTLQDIRIEEVSESVEVGNGNITNLFNSYTSTTQTTLGDFDKGIKSNSGDIKEVNELLNEHINDVNNPHQTSFDNLTSTAHTHTISDVIGLQNELDDINKSILSIDDVYVNQGSVDALNQKLIFTNTGGGTFEVTNAAALFTDNDIHVVSGLYNPSTGIVTYTTNVGTTFEVSGFAKELTDSYTTAANLNGEIISFDNNVNGDGLYSVDLSTMLQPLKDRLGDLENAEDADTFTESVSLSNNTLTFNRNDSQTYSVDLSPLNSADNDWSVNGNNMYSLPSGNVGIGTNSPQNKLHIEGSDYSDSSIRYHNKANNNNNNYWMTGMRSYANGIHGFEIGSNGDVGGGKLYIDNDGNVGIGTNHQPQSKLHVKGNIFIDNNNSSLKINNYTFPSSDGDDGQVLKTDGNGNVSWSNDNDTNTDIYTTSVSLNNNTLTFNRNDSQTYSVDLSSLNSEDNDWAINGNNMYSLPSGNVGIGTNSPQNKLHIEGSGFDNSAIRFLNTAGGFSGNEDYWLMGSRSFSSGADGFEIGRNSETAGGKLYITNGGNVSIGNGTSPTNKLEVAGSTLITNPNSTSDILSVESKYSNLTYGGISGVGNFTNNLILKHKNIGGTSDTSSSIQIRNGGTGDTDKTSIELTTYFNNGGADISYNGLIMNSGGNNVNIISADNDAENAILSIQADESISFQSSIGAGASWPNDSKKTMTIDLTNDKVIVDGGFTLNNGSQGAGKVLVSDDEGNTTWGYYGLKLDYVNVKNISFGSSYNLLENTFTKVLTWETQENNTPDFILPVISSESKGNEVVVKHVGGKQSIVIVAPGVTKIDNQYSSVNITNGDSITFYCDGINWYIKSHYKNIFGDIPGFFYTNDPIGGDTRIYFTPEFYSSRDVQSSPSGTITSIHIAANARYINVHTTDEFVSTEFKTNEGASWFVGEVTGDAYVSPTSGRDGEQVFINSGDIGGTIRFVTSNGKASTLTVTSAR